jgi:prevent-host-death family protein
MKMSVSSFKAKCTHVMREVAEKYGTVEVTNRGKVVAVIEAPKPARKKNPRSFFGSLAGTASHVGDLVSPAASAREWDAAR